MKPIRTKPMLYAYFLGEIQERAREMGYNILLHGSLQRDCDIVAVPWIDQPRPELELITMIDKLLNGETGKWLPKHYMFSVLPGGRRSYVVNVRRTDWIEDKQEFSEDIQMYLDISITPLVSQP